MKGASEVLWGRLCKHGGHLWEEPGFHVRDKELTMTTRCSAPSNGMRSRCFFLALALAGFLSVPATAADRVVFGEEFSAAW